jgi:hypothetical protein
MLRFRLLGSGTDPTKVPGFTKTPHVRLARTACLTALAVTLILGLGLSPGTARAAGARCGDASTAATRLSPVVARTTVRCLINEERAAHGLPQLRNSRRLARSAQNWVNKLVLSDVFDHGDIAARVLAAGINFAFAGEDLATGQATPSQVVAAWMASPDHCRNILSPEFSEFGTAVNPHPIVGWATGPSTWAVDFVLPRGHRAPSRNWRPAKGCPY